MIFCGLVGATIAGVIIDYTKKYKETAVISVAFSVLCFVWFMEVGTNLCVCVSEYPFWRGGDICPPPQIVTVHLSSNKTFSNH